MGKESEQQPPAPGGTGDGPGAATPPNAGTPQPVQFTPEQQAHIDAIVKERLARGREKWEADNAAARQKAEQEAEAARLAEQQKWQELAQKREAEAKALEGKLKEAEGREGRLARLEAALEAHLDTQRAGLPAHLLTLLDKMPVEEQLEYLAGNAAALRPAGGQQASIPPTPQAQGAPGLSEEQRRAASAGIRSYW